MGLRWTLAQRPTTTSAQVSNRLDWISNGEISRAFGLDDYGGSGKSSMLGSANHRADPSRKADISNAWHCHRNSPPCRHYERRYLLDGSFRLDSPGVYPIRARHKIDIYAGGTDYRVIASQDLVSEFRLNIAEHDDKELASAYAPVLRDLDSQGGFTSSLAIEAVVQHPPRFLEEVILSLADHPQTAAASVTGLERLATPRAKAKLGELSAPGNPEAIRQSAISALATLGDPAYCSSMLSIGQESSQYSRWLALRAAGYLCGEKALPLLKSLLSSADSVSRFEVAYALGNSHSREAVPLLISLLLDANSNVRRASVDSLTNLTHRSSTSGIDQQEAAGTAHDDWIRWWASEGATAKIYRIDDCSERMPLQ
jgi:hypothetical protein